MMRSGWDMVSLAALALVAGACGRVTEAEYDDIATGVGALVGDGSGGEVEGLKDGARVAHGELPAGFSKQASGMLRGRRGSLDYEVAVTCTDVAGSVQSVCDETTDTARLVLHWTGEIDAPRFDATIDRSGDWTLSGLQSGTAELNGTGSFDVDSEFMAFYQPVTRTFLLEYDARYDGVKLRLDDGVITAGTIEYEVHAKKTATRGTRTAERELDVTAQVTFTGEGTAQLVLDGDRRYVITLADGTIVRGAAE